ncbi:MAG: CAP domain-containing protein, partial [Planctomycetota bacterium]
MSLRVLLILVIAGGSAQAEELFNGRVGTLEPFPREIGRGKELILKGELKGAFKIPQLIIIAPDGRTFLNKDNEIAGHRFTFTVAFENGVGRYRMEIIAVRTTTIRSLARFSVWHGKRKPKVDPDPPTPEGPIVPLALHPRLIEKRLHRMLNEFRRSIRLGEVGWNEAVAARAREHALRMARANRRIHAFSGVGGVMDMLRRDGAGKGGLSGPTDPWFHVVQNRPFPRPAPQPIGPRVRNFVVPFVLRGESLEVVFEMHFVREAAFRICALDPHCVEVGIGAAHYVPKPPKEKKGKKPPPPEPRTVYYSVNFVQANSLAVIEAQNRAFEALLKRAAAREPLYLRTLGIWGRPQRSLALLDRARKDLKPDVAGAAFDGLLLLDEERAHAALKKVIERSDFAMKRGRYGTAAALWLPYEHVEYDARIIGRARTTRGSA